MAEQDLEQSRTEEATPFKLKRAREKGLVARSMDLGYFASLAAFGAFLMAAGGTLASRLAEMMQLSIATGISASNDPSRALDALSASYWPLLQTVGLLGGTILITVILLEIVQLRGLVFSTQPLKPDFSRLNPAKGFKRLFSAHLLKQAVKNIIKFGAYSAMTVALLWALLDRPQQIGLDARGVVMALDRFGLRLLGLFLVVALAFAALDQILVRRDYSKQMRMSRREIVREMKEREGDPRLRQKRKQIHAEFARQTAGLGSLGGADLLVVNPEHVAVALSYDPEKMAAPAVLAKGRNRHALLLKAKARRLAIPIFESPPLARQLYDQCAAGQEIGADHYRAVADLYLRLRASE